jgi:4'-phosphopantetheinyl transferase
VRPQLGPLGPLDVHVWTVALDGGGRSAARGALYELLTRYTGAPKGPDTVTPDEFGKPRLSDRALEFNMSHSGEQALIAIALELPVGVDLERPRQLLRPDALARRICSAAEQEQLRAAPDLNAALLRLWVRKEALVKASGTGIRGPLHSLAELDTVAGVPGWQVQDLPAPAPGYVAALAHPPADLQVRFLS